MQYFAFKQSTQFNDGLVPWVVSFIVDNYDDKMLTAIRSTMNRAALKDDPSVAIDLLRRRCQQDGIMLDRVTILGEGNGKTLDV